MKLSKYTIFHKQNDNVYIYNQISMALLEIDNELYDILKQGNMNIVHNDVMKVLRDNGFIVNNNVNESDKICYANMKNRYNSKFMRITILPTLIIVTLNVGIVMNSIRSHRYRRKMQNLF